MRTPMTSGQFNALAVTTKRSIITWPLTNAHVYKIINYIFFTHESSIQICTYYHLK